VIQEYAASPSTAPEHNPEKADTFLLVVGCQDGDRVVFHPAVSVLIDTGLQKMEFWRR
jgi:hypothetical protein